MNKIIFSFLFCVAMLLHGVSFAAGTFYVSQSGTATKAGATSVSTPMSVATHNASTFAAGDVIYILDTITSSIDPPSNGESGNVITYRGDYAGHFAEINRYNEAFDLAGNSYITLYNETTRATIDGELSDHNINDGQNSTRCISVDDSDHITIDNWLIENAWTAIEGADADYLTITRCKIQYMAQSGISMQDPGWPDMNEYLTIGGSEANGNEIYNCTRKTVRNWPNTVGADIFLRFTENFVVSYNELHATDDTNDWWGQIGISINIGPNNGLVEYNSIHDHSAAYFRAGIGIKSENGAELRGRIYDIIVRYNHIYDLPLTDDIFYGGGPGITISRDSQNLRVYGNRIWNTNIGIALDINGEYNHPDGEDGVHLEDVYIWGNIINTKGENNGISAVSGSSTNTDNFDDIYIVNNTVESGGYGIRLYVRYQNLSGSPGMFTVSNNMLYRCGESLSPAAGETYPLVAATLLCSVLRDNYVTSQGDYLNFDNNFIIDETPRDTYPDPDVTFTPGTMWFICGANDTSCSTRVRKVNDISFWGSAITSAWFDNFIVSSDPLMTDGDGGDYTLAPNSMAIGYGKDMSGVSVPSITVQGTTYNFSLRTILGATSAWTTHPPAPVAATNTNNDIGAFVYSAPGTEPPQIISAYTDATGDLIYIVTSEDIVNSTGFSLTADSAAVGITYQSGSGESIYTFSTASTLDSTDVLLLSYSPGNVVDEDATPQSLAAFSDRSVTNLVSAGGTGSYEYTYIGYTNTDGVMATTSGGIHCDYGNDTGDRGYARQWYNETGDEGTIDGISIRFDPTSPDTDWDHAWLAIYSDGTLLGYSESISSTQSGGQTIFYPLSPIAGETLDLTPDTTYRIAFVYDMDGTGDVDFCVDDNETSAQTQYFTNSSTTAPPATPSWATASQDGYMMVLRIRTDSPVEYSQHINGSPGAYVFGTDCVLH